MTGHHPDEVGAEFENGVLVEAGGEALFGQLDVVALHAGEADFERVAVWNGFDLNRLTRWLRWSDDGLRREVEGDAENIGILDIEESLFV